MYCYSNTSRATACIALIGPIVLKYFIIFNFYNLIRKAMNFGENQEIKIQRTNNLFFKLSIVRVSQTMKNINIKLSNYITSI